MKLRAAGPAWDTSPLIHIDWIAPGPLISANAKSSPGLMTKYGETFQSCPRSRAQAAAAPSVDMPALPFAPVWFSGLIDRVWAFDSRDRLPRPMPRPLNDDIRI